MYRYVVTIQKSRFCNVFGGSYRQVSTLLSCDYAAQILDLLCLAHIEGTLVINLSTAHFWQPIGNQTKFQILTTVNDVGPPVHSEDLLLDCSFVLGPYEMQRSWSLQWPT